MTEAQARGRCRRADRCDRAPFAEDKPTMSWRGQTAVAQRPRVRLPGFIARGAEEGGVRLSRRRRRVRGGRSPGLHHRPRAAEKGEILAAWLPLPPYEENLAKCREILPEETDDFLARYAETHSCVPTGAMTMTDNWSGAVKVMASGLPFEFSQFDLAVQAVATLDPPSSRSASSPPWRTGSPWVTLERQEPDQDRMPLPCCP